MSEPSFRPELDKIEHRAEANPQLATEAGEWLNSHGTASEMVRASRGADSIERARANDSG